MSQPRNTFVTPKGYRAMKTFILKWNPQESSFGLEDFSHAISSMEFGDLPWMFRRRCGIRSGDNFYLVKVGDGLEGIVMKGFFRTQPEAYSGDADGGLTPEMPMVGSGPFSGQRSWLMSEGMRISSERRCWMIPSRIFPGVRNASSWILPRPQFSPGYGKSISPASPKRPS